MSSPRPVRRLIPLPPPEDMPGFVPFPVPHDLEEDSDPGQFFATADSKSVPTRGYRCKACGIRVLFEVCFVPGGVRILPVTDGRAADVHVDRMHALGIACCDTIKVLSVMAS